MKPTLYRDAGDLDPVFGANKPFKLNILPPAGIIKQIDFYVRGQHTTNITTAFTDGEVNYLSAFKVTAKRKHRPDVVWEALPRDLKWLTALLQGQLAPCANPATAGSTAATAHFGLFSVFFAPPRRRCRFPDDWGLDTDELAGPIIVEGRYGAVTDIGTGATAIADAISATLVFEEHGPETHRPGLVMGCQKSFFPHESDIRSKEQPLPTGNLELYVGTMFRSHDDSAQAAQRIDGIPTRITLQHSKKGIIAGDLFITEKKRTGIWSGLANADVPAGVILPLASREFIASEMIAKDEGDFSLFIDTAETTPDEVTAVTPTTSDGIHALALGAYLSGRSARAHGV